MLIPIISPTEDSVVLEYTDSYALTTNGIVYSQSVSIGDAAADRVVIVCVGGSDTASMTISGVTFAGSAMTQTVLRNDNNVVAGIYRLAVPSGTTGTVQVTFSDTADRCALDVYTLKNLDSAVPEDTLQTVDDLGYIEGAIDFKAGGAVVAFATSRNSTGFAWVNLTKDSDQAIEATTTFSAASTSPNADSTTTIRADPGGSADLILVAASWR